MARMVAFFEARGFAVEMHDERVDEDWANAELRIPLLMVGETREEVVAAAVEQNRKMAVTNRILFVDTELAEFVGRADRLKARSHIVEALVYFKLGKETAQEDILFSERSSWFRKDALRCLEYFKERSEKRAGEACAKLEGLVEQEAQSEELVELLKETVPYAFFAVFFFGFRSLDLSGRPGSALLDIRHCYRAGGAQPAASRRGAREMTTYSLSH